MTLGVAQNKTDVDFPFVQALTKSVDLTSASPGEQLTYTLYPRYFGDNLLTGAVVNDTIPAGTTYVDTAPSVNAGGEAVDEYGTGGQRDRLRGLGPGQQRRRQPGYSGGTAMCPATQTIVAGRDTWIDENDITKNNGAETGDPDVQQGRQG